MLLHCSFVLICFTMLSLPYGYAGLEDTFPLDTSSSNNVNVPPYEVDALYDLYVSAGGDQWFWGQSPGVPWNFTKDANPCIDDWEGILCNYTVTGGYIHINSIYLFDFGLEGILPPSIGNISDLVNLTLANNLLQSTIPNSINQLSSLTILDLNANVFTGTFPDDLSGLSGLRTIDIGYSYLEGSILTSVCTLMETTYLDISGNMFTGSIPECLSELVHLTVLNIGANRLTGTLPYSLGSLLSLHMLYTALNNFHGTLPESIGLLTNITTLWMWQNQLSGSIPSTIGNLQYLQDVDLHENMLTGPLPMFTKNSRNINTLNLKNNYFNSTLPLSLGSLSGLTYLSLDFNHLTGTIPTELGALSFLNSLGLADNSLSGTIPYELGQLTSLQNMLLARNHLTGVIPDIFNLTTATVVKLNSNLLSGTIPLSLLYSSYPLGVDISENRISGTIPDILSSETTFQIYLNIAFNYLTGVIPSGLSLCDKLIYFNTTDNWLGGSLPDEIVQWQILNFLYMDNNLLSGPIPDQLGSLTDLSYLFLSHNLFSSSIPSSLGLLPRLVNVNFANNKLRGSIPTSIAHTPILSTLSLSFNQLTGPIDQILHPWSNLTTILLSHNQLTGTLPDGLASLDSLKVFAAVSNCFEGSIPTSLCDSSSLITLALDGLQSATSCQRKLFPAALEGSVVAKGLYSIANPMRGGVPECLFMMGNLTTLHLSGNGLTGSLSENITISPVLVDISLSHNAFHGKIPSAMLARDWTNLDLSYNRFDGTIYSRAADSYDNGTAIFLDNNRISGVVPRSFLHLFSVSILQSNLFTCKSDSSNLPQSDPYRDKYECGSSVFDDALYVWLAMVISVVLIAAVILLGRCLGVDRLLSAHKETMVSWWTAADNFLDSKGHGSGGGHIQKLHFTAAGICRTAIRCMVFSMVVLLPIYATCTALYGTYTHQYAWSVSAAYLSGKTTFALTFTGLSLLVVVAIFSLSYQIEMHREKTAYVVQKTNAAVDMHINRNIVYFLVVLVNFGIVLGANIAYVVIALNQNSSALTLAQIALALFKVVFNGGCSPWLMRRVCQRFLGRQPSAPSYISLQLLVSCINNVAVPCLVVAIISPSCFYHIFKGANEVNAYFSYPGKCTNFEIQGTYILCDQSESLQLDTSYNPPFSYSYQCSSSFITYYSPAFVIMCIIAGIGLPAAQMFLLYLHQRAAADTWWRSQLDYFLPRILQPIDMDNPAHRDPFRMHFDACQHVITLLMYLALLLTFGAVFPPLAVCFAVTMVSMTIFSRLKVGRFLYLLRQQTHRERGAGGGQGCVLAEPVEPESSLSQQLERECEGVGDKLVLVRALVMLVVLSGLFYTLFLFDTLGDAVGFSQAFWVLIAIPMLPVVLLYVWRIRGPCIVMLTAATAAAEGGDLGLESGNGTGVINVEIKSPIFDENEVL